MRLASAPWLSGASQHNDGNTKHHDCRGAVAQAVYLLGILGAFSGGGCLNAARTDTPDTVASERALVDAIWTWERAPIVAVVETSSAVDIERFQRAVRFFEKTTGIEYQNGSYVGKIPSPALRSALTLWDQWYAANGTRLRLAESCLVLTPLETTRPSNPPPP